MNDTSNMPRVKAMLSVVAASVLIWIVGTAAQQPPQRQSNFVGGNPTSVDATAIRTTRLRFPAGSRSNWHTHTHGQLLMIEQGKARTQERGGPLLEMQSGQPWYTKPGVEHWHGAAPDQDALQLTIYEGEVKWLEPVTDEIYKAAPKK